MISSLGKTPKVPLKKILLGCEWSAPGGTKKLQQEAWKSAVEFHLKKS